MANWAWVYVANLKGPKGDTGAQGPGNGYKGILPNGTDFNTLTAESDTGFYHLSSANTYVNAPDGFSGSGLLWVTSSGISAVEQRLIRNTMLDSYRRTILSYTATPKTWNPWEPEKPRPVDVTTGQNLDDIRTEGEYRIQNGTIAASLTGGWPDDLGIARTTARLEVRVAGAGIVFQKLHVFGATGTLLERHTSTISTTPFPFSAWVDLAAIPVGSAGDPGADSALANMVRVSDFTYRRGGVKKTNGLPVVAIRADHGLNNFNDKLRGPHEARGIPYGLALNSRTWTASENNTVTASMVNTWVTGGLCEVWNHGANGHSDATTTPALEDAIVNGLTELQAQIPAASIDGWVVPGVGGTNYNGFNGGQTVAGFLTMAGRLILKNHAVSTGAFPNTHRRILDGQVRQGQGHFGMESRTAAQIIAEISAVQTAKQGLQLMIHPSLVDQPGYITTADYVAVLDYIKAEKDAGRLLVMGMYDLLLADARGTTDPGSGTPLIR